MAVTFVEIRVKGKDTRVPTVQIAGQTVIAKGNRMKIASIRDEDVTEGELVKNPKAFVAELKKAGLRADVFTFFQRPPDVTPKFPLHFELENYAVVPVTTFEAWWEKLPQEARKNFPARGETRRRGQGGSF